MKVGNKEQRARRDSKKRKLERVLTKQAVMCRPKRRAEHGEPDVVQRATWLDDTAAGGNLLVEAGDES